MKELTLKEIQNLLDYKAKIAEDKHTNILEDTPIEESELMKREILLHSMISYHNSIVDKMQNLAESLIETYEDVEETDVNNAYVDVWNEIIQEAIWLCCEINDIDDGLWYTTDDWLVVKDEDVEE